MQLERLQKQLIYTVAILNKDFCNFEFEPPCIVNKQANIVYLGCVETQIMTCMYGFFKD